MTCVYASRWACARRGAMSLTITESSSATYTVTASADTSHSFYHGDSTDDTSDGIPVADDGTICFGVWLEDKLNSAAAGLANDYGVAFAPTTGIYTISRTSGSATFALTFSTLGAAGTRMRQALGMDADKTTATSQTSTRCPHFWLVCGGDRADYSDRQPSTEAVRGTVRYSSSGARFGVAPSAVPQQHSWTQRFLSHSLAHNSQDTTTEGDVWTAERFFEHHRDGERFLFFPSTVVGTSACSYSNRDRAYSFSQAGIDNWSVARTIPNSNLYWELAFDCVEYDAGNPAGSDPALLAWSDMTFTRASVGTYRTTANTIADAAINEARYEDIGDGNGTDLLLIEGARSNLLDYSESTWATIGTMGISNNTHVAPDGAVIADTLTVVTGSSGTGTGDLAYHTFSATNTTKYTLSVWLKWLSGGTTVRTRLYVTAFSAVEQTTTGSWARYGGTATATATATGYSGVGSYQDAGEPTVSTSVNAGFGDQVEAGAFPSSYIRGLTGSTTARTADTATWTDSVASMRSGRWQIIARPLFASADLVSGDIFVLGSFVDANNSLRIRHNGSDIKVEAYAGSSVKASSSAITWSRDQTLRITVDCGAATVGVTGATTGNGTGSAGTAWTWSTGTFRLGGNVSGTAEAFAALSLPMAA